MRDFKILKLLDKLNFLFTKFGIDYPVMRQLLQVKLLMDERKAPTYFNQSKKKNEEKRYGYIKSLWIHLLIGLVLVPLMAYGDNYIFQMSIAYAIIIFMIMSTLISEFSSVLLDVRDKNILSSKPISEKTLNAAKFMHILIYLTYLSIALTGIALIFTLINKGILFFLLTIFIILFINIFVVVLTAIIYIFILRFFDGEKLKDVINYVQIGLSLSLMIGYQVLIRSFSLVDFNVAVEFHWWSAFLIPMWFAAPYEFLFNQSQTVFTIGLSILAIIIPILAIWLYIKLIPTFERNLEKLLATSRSKKEKNNPVKQFLLKCICPSSEEQAFYRFASLMMKQEREFKLKVYPSLGFSFVIPFIFLINNFSFEEVDFSTSLRYFTIYFSMIIIPSAVMMVGYSAKYKAAWIFKVAPIEDYSKLNKGTLKAFLMKLFLPLYFAISVIFCFIFGIRIIADLLGILVTGFLYTVICYVVLGKFIPFTKPMNEVNEGQSLKIIILSIPLLVLFGLHFFIVQSIPYGSIIYLVFIVIVNLLVWRFAFGKVSRG